MAKNICETTGKRNRTFLCGRCTYCNNKSFDAVKEHYDLMVDKSDDDLLLIPKKDNKTYEFRCAKCSVLYSQNLYHTDIDWNGHVACKGAIDRSSIDFTDMSLPIVDMLYFLRSRRITPRIKRIVRKRDGQKCQLCKKVVMLKKIGKRAHNKLNYDHIIPFSRGGCSCENNIQILCYTCNMSKGAKMFSKFKTDLIGVRFNNCNNGIHKVDKSIFRDLLEKLNRFEEIEQKFSSNSYSMQGVSDYLGVTIEQFRRIKTHLYYSVIHLLKRQTNPTNKVVSLVITDHITNIKENGSYTVRTLKFDNK